MVIDRHSLRDTDYASRGSMASHNAGDLIIVDPDGDLVLKVGKEEDTQNGSISTGSEDSAPAEIQVATQPRWVNIRVSSKFLTTNSPVFKAMLRGPFKEGQLHLSALQPPTLHLPDDEPTAMLALCEVLHCKENIARDEFERKFLKTITDVANMSDKYGCSNAAVAWFHHQLHRRRQYDRHLTEVQLATLLNAALLLDDNETFHYFTVVAGKFLRREMLDTDFGKALLPQLREHILPVLQKLHSIHVATFQTVVQTAISEMFEASAGDDMQYQDREGREMEIEGPCVGAAKQAGALLSMLKTVTTWPENDPYPVAFWSVNGAWNTYQNLLIYMQHKRSDFVCSNSGCQSCATNICSYVGWTIAHQLQLSGICLVCLKSQQVSVPLKDCEHVARIALTEVTWSVYP